MKKLIVSFLLIIFCYGFTYSTKEVKTEMKCSIIKKETPASDKKLTAGSNIEETFHPLLFLKISFK